MAVSGTTARRGVFHALRVSTVERLCDDAVAVNFDVPQELADVYAFRAGQSITLRRRIGDREQRRTYSICAPEGAAPRIGVREVPGGLFSTWLVRRARPGDAVEVGPPSGSFTPRGAPGHHVLVAAGSGITPVLSIAQTVLRHPEATATLLYGNRRSDTVMFTEELADLKDRYPTRVELVHVLSRESRATELFTGRLDAAKMGELVPLIGPPSEVDHWWLCGPYGLVSEVRKFLRKQDVPDDRVHHELFYVDDPPPPPVRREESSDGNAREVTVVLDGRSTTVALDRNTPILDGAQRVRPDLPFACKGGVCGTCRAKVTSGRVTMRRNFALEQSEVDQGFVLTCQSLPDSDSVTVDYDG